jgi:hypothetical protein
VRAVAIIAVMSVISGCGIVPKKVTPEQTAASTRFYPGKTAAELKVASEKTLTLLVPDRMKLDVQDNDVRARYNYSYAQTRIGYVGNTTSFFTDHGIGVTWYEVVFTEEAGGTRARLSYLNRGDLTKNVISPEITALHNSFRSDIPMTGRTSVEDFTLFHDRVEYLVGLRSAWAPCPTTKVTERTFMEFCDRTGLKNDAP